MVTNSEIMQGAFCVKNIAALTADTDIYITDVAYFAGIYDGNLNPFMANPSSTAGRSYRILDAYNRSGNDILILLNGDRDHSLFLPAGGELHLDQTDKIAYFFLVIRSLTAQTGAGDLIIQGRRLE